MKRIFLIIFLFISFQSKAQVSPYQPLLDSINRWTFTEDFMPAIPEMSNCSYPFYAYSNIEMYTGMDTIINSNTYKNIIVDSNCIFGYIREDTASKKIYFLDNNFNPEQLLYDFSMQIGDSIQLQFYLNGIYDIWHDGIYYLDSIGVISTGLGFRNVFYLNCDTCTNCNTLSWIEGIGNLKNPIYTYSDNSYSWGSFGQWGCINFPHNYGGGFVTCFEHNQKVYYDSCAYTTAFFYSCCFTVQDSCHYYVSGGAVNDFDFSSSITISSNPFREKAKLVINDQSIHECNLKIYDLTGRILHVETIYGNTINIDGQMFEDGIYLFRLFSKNGHYASGKLVKE